MLAEILWRRVSSIIRTTNQQLAADALKAAVAGGFRMVEFTLTTPNALELVTEFSRNPDLLVGAGTARSLQDGRFTRWGGEVGTSPQHFGLAGLNRLGAAPGLGRVLGTRQEPASLLPCSDS